MTGFLLEEEVLQNPGSRIPQGCTKASLITARSSSEYCSRVFMKARCQNLPPSLLTAEQSRPRSEPCRCSPDHPNKCLFSLLLDRTHGTPAPPRPAASQQAADGRFAPPRCKRTLVSNKNAVLSAVFATTPTRNTNGCVESVKSADVVSGAAAGGRAGGAV